MVARLQGWQDDWGWRFSGRKTARYRQIGNAFPPPVAQALGSAIRSALEHAGAPEADAAGDADSPDGAHVHDPVFRVLRSRADFLTARQIAQLAAGLSAGAGLSQTAVLGGCATSVRTSSSRWPTLAPATLAPATAPAYRLGGFKAFLGQPGHVRHERFAARRTTIS